MLADNQSTQCFGNSFCMGVLKILPIKKVVEIVMKKKWQLIRFLAGSLGLISIINFLIFVGISVHVGGFPNYEKSIGGKYYLSDHGIDTEVCEQTFTFMEWYTVITWGLLILFPLLLVIKELFNRLYRLFW